MSNGANKKNSDFSANKFCVKYGTKILRSGIELTISILILYEITAPYLQGKCLLFYDKGWRLENFLNEFCIVVLNYLTKNVRVVV